MPRPFPSPSDQGPGCLMGSPAPPPASQRLVGAVEPLGRHGDALEARVPSAQHQGLNLHNLPLRGWGWGPARPWPRLGEGGEGRLTVPNLPLPALGAGAEPAQEPHGTHLTVTRELKCSLGLCRLRCSSRRLGGAEGPGIYLKMSGLPVKVCSPASPRQCYALCSRGRPWQSFVELSPHESRDGPLRCRGCIPQTQQPCLRVSKVTGLCTDRRSGGCH